MECADQHDPSRGQEEQTNPRQSDFDAGQKFPFQLKNPGETFHFHSCRGSHQFLAGEDFSISSVLFFPFRLPIWSLATGICQSDKREKKLKVSWKQSTIHMFEYNHFPALNLLFRMLVGPNCLREVRHKPF